MHDDQAPYIFASAPERWGNFRDHLANECGGSPDEIRIVGSGRFGFSMKPGHNLRAFSDASDIDVIIVNSRLFDDLWLWILDAAYPRGSNMERLGDWLQARRREVYTGWLTPLEIKLDHTIVGTKAKPVLDFNARWFNALKEAARYSPRRHENINGRLYRTWRHAELYHVNSLAALRRSLTE